MNNIAEGFERKGNKEFKRFLFIAKGSCGEVRSMVYLAYKLNYFSQDEFKKINFNSNEITKMLGSFIKKL
jgi:four helix bundle protein